jgi:transcriptional regulator with XRE-family HTH domain
VTRPARTATPATELRTDHTHRILRGPQPVPAVKEPLWRHIVGDVLRRERLAQERRLRDVADEARISMPYLSEIERGRKEASSEVLAAAAHALGLSLADLLTLAQAELARLTQPGQPQQARHPDRPSQTIAPVQPTPDRDLDTETTVSPEAGDAPADQPSTAEASLASAKAGAAGTSVTGEMGIDVAGEVKLPLGVAGAGVAGEIGVDVAWEVGLPPGGVGAAGAVVADDTEAEDADEAKLALGEIGPAEVRVADVAGLSSWPVKLSLVA